MQIQTPRLLLRPTATSDRLDLHRLEQDPEVMRHLNGGGPTPLDTPMGEKTGFLMPRGRDDRGVWTVLLRDGGDFLGWVALKVENGVGDLGYRFARTAWGQGFATEAAGAVVENAFVRLGATRIVADTMAVNLRSRRVMERLGMRWARTFFADFPELLPGGQEGDVEYLLTREEWRRSAAGPGAVG